MVRKPGSKHSEPSSRVIARRNDWNSIRVLHQGPRSNRPHSEAVYMTAPRSLAEAPKKTLAERGPSIHDGLASPRLRAQQRHLRPQRLPPRGLLRVVGSRKIRARIWPHDHVGHVIESIRPINLKSIPRPTDPDPRVLRQEPVDAFSRRPQRRVGQAVLFAIPEMTPCLIARLDLLAVLLQRRPQSSDHGVFGFPRCIGIEIEHVVIHNPV